MQPKLTDALITVVLRIMQAKNSFVQPANITEAKAMFPEAFNAENEAILTEAWADINSPA